MISFDTVLTDGVVSLRPIGPEDTQVVVEAVLEFVTEIMPWMTWCTPNYNYAEARAFLSTLSERWEQGLQYGFAIVDAQTHQFLGGAGLNHINYATRLANLSYWVRTSTAGRGIATRAARLVGRFGVKQVGLLRAEIVVAVENKASLRVANKTGAKREGVLRNRLIVRDTIYDAVMHSLTPQDFELMKILLTGFEPFGNSPINPSEQVVLSLAKETFPNVKLEPEIFPVDLKKGPEILLRAFEAVQPDAVLCLGLATRRTVISIERVAVNLLDFRIPDNAGNQIVDQPVIPGAPDAYFTTLPVRKIYNELKTNGIPVELSLSAGAYLCNQITFVLLHHLQNQGLKIPAGFIHLPALPEQAAEMKGSIPSMSLETMVQGIRAAIQFITQEKL